MKKKLLKTSLKAKLKNYQNPRLEAASNTSYFKSSLSQIPSSINIVKTTLFQNWNVNLDL